MNIDKEREAFDRWFYLAPTKIPPETFTDDFYGIALEVWRSALAAQKLAEVDAIHRLVTEKFTSGNLIPVERITITRAEYDAIAQKGKEQKK